MTNSITLESANIISKKAMKIAKGIENGAFIGSVSYKTKLLAELILICDGDKVKALNEIEIALILIQDADEYESDKEYIDSYIANEIKLLNNLK